MKYRHSIFLSLAIIVLSCKETSSKKTLPKIDTQKEINSFLEERLKAADTILMVSHTGHIFDSVNSKMISPELLINNKINRKIIHEQMIVTGASIDTLTRVLLMPTYSADIEHYMCFDPHHTIFITQNNRISYIDICFTCWGLSTSDDLTEIQGYDKLKWKEIYSLFKKWGFKYEMTP